MGLTTSKFSTGGTLKGAFAPPLANIQHPPKLDPAVKQCQLMVPDDKAAGDAMMVNIKGNMVTATIPATFMTPKGGKPILEDLYSFRRHPWPIFELNLSTSKPIADL